MTRGLFIRLTPSSQTKPNTVRRLLGSSVDGGHAKPLQPAIDTSGGLLETGAQKGFSRSFGEAWKVPSTGAV